MDMQRQRRIEAINGTWAMLGLTAGLVIEGRTGDSIITQVSFLAHVGIMREEQLLKL